jgi:tetratricopeptide (TPR) repeat protein
MNKKLLIISLLIFNIAWVAETKAQQSEYYDQPASNYRQAVELFEKQAYSPAKEVFNRLISQDLLKTELEKENASYYIAVCAVELGDKDALNKVETFASYYPESKWLPAINYDLGKIYFNKKQYSQALESFDQVTTKNLSREQRSALNYMKGFCYLKRSDFEKAISSFNNVDKKSNKYFTSAEFYKSHIYYQQEDYEKALVGFKSLEGNRKFKKHIPNYLINIYYHMGNFQMVIDEGILYLPKANRKSKADIARLIANSYYELNDYEKALEYYQVFENSARRKVTPGEQYRIGYTKFMAGKYKDAIRNFQLASSEKDSMMQNAWYHLGFCYINTGEQKFAQNAFLKAFKADYDNTVTTDALFNYEKISIEQGGDMYNDPLAILQEFINNNANNPRINEAYDLMAQLYLSSKNYGAALRSIEKTTSLNSKLKQVYQQLAYYQAIDYFNRGSFTEASGYFKKSLKYNSDKETQALASFWYADALYRLKKYSTSETKYKQFLQNPMAKKTGLYNEAVYNLAYSSFNQKKYSQAIKQFNDFLLAGNNKANLKTDAMLRLADSYFILKQYTSALKWYEKVISGGTQDIDYALYQKAFCYGAAGDFNNKIATLEEMVRSQKRSELYDDAIYEIASTYSILNDQRHAISNYEKLVKEKPRSSFAKKSLVKMGFLYYNNNQYENAIAKLKQVIDKYPASLEAREAINTLENIYMDMGKIDDYFAYAKTLDFIQVSTSQEDSLTFTTAENYFLEDDCNNAIKQLSKYVQSFPKGGYVLKAYNYLSICSEKLNDSVQATVYYEKIVSFPENQYSEYALMKLARLSFANKDFQKSMEYYDRLAIIAEDKGRQLEAIDGSMRAAFMIGDFNKASAKSTELLKTEKLSEDQMLKAHFIAAKSAYELKKTNISEREFGITDRLTTGEFGAESKYMLALINYRANKLDIAENLVYELSDQYPSFGYWVAKGFILLSDIYFARDNIFQAEQTLQSIIDNYQGEDLKKEAQGKLDRLQERSEKRNETKN